MRPDRKARRSLYDRETIARCLERVRQDESTYHISRDLGIPLGTLDSWVRQYGPGVRAIRRRRQPITPDRLGVLR